MTNERIQREKELVAAWLNYRMGAWLRSATYASIGDGYSGKILPTDCISRQCIEQYATYCIDQLASVAMSIAGYQPVVEVSHDGHVTIAVR